jgi:thiamine biosynthesis protein ThiS
MDKIPTIQLVVNGKPLQFPQGISVAQLLEQLKIETRAIAVEVNHQIQPAEGFSQRTLHDGDRLEVVTLVGGG